MVYLCMAWIEQELDRPSLLAGPPGYTTCAWHTVRTALILFDRSGWFARSGPGATSPTCLRCAGLSSAKPPILRGIVPSYRDNLEKSLARRDLVFINNEVTWLLVAYFDILFALNNVPHPGASGCSNRLSACARAARRTCPPRSASSCACRRRRCPPPARARPPGR